MPGIPKYVQELAADIVHKRKTAEEAVDVIRKKMKNVLTRVDYVSKLKKHVNTLGGGLRKEIRATDEEIAASYAIQAANQKQRHENVKEVEAAPHIRAARRAVSAEYRNEMETLHLVVALAILTGRRQAEIMVTAHFTPYDATHVMFEGQVKRRGKEDGAYLIPVLADPDDIIASIKLVRKAYPKLKVEEVNHPRIEGALNTLVKEITGGALTFHDLRMMYAHATFELTASKASISAHVSRVLGHADLGPSTSYLKLKISDPAEVRELQPSTGQKKN